MKVLTVVGARPQFIKAAPVSRALRRMGREVLVHTGQHYDAAMSDIFFTELELPAPDYHLGVGSGSHGAQTGQMLTHLEAVMERERPDWVLVYGDTNSTLAGALAATKLHLPVAHVEAGLRSYNRQMPEEINRVVTDHVSTLLLCPTDTAVVNLAREGITVGVHQVGDVMYDATLQLAPLARDRSALTQRLGLRAGEYILLTVHRADNTDSPERLGAILRTVAAAGLPVVFPVHPRTRTRLATHGLEPLLDSPLQAIEPVSYLNMLALEQGAAVIVTDSGGVQKEAFMFGVPCITCRTETEWTETVTAGANVLVGADPERLAAALVSPSRPQPAADFYGDGRAAERIAAILFGGLAR